MQDKLQRHKSSIIYLIIVIGAVSLKRQFGAKLRSQLGKDLPQHGDLGLQRQRGGRGLQQLQGDHGTGMFEEKALQRE